MLQVCMLVCCNTRQTQQELGASFQVMPPTCVCSGNHKHIADMQIGTTATDKHLATASRTVVV